MDIGICVASKIDDIDYIERAEKLGYSHAWVADSQMIWSDCYAVLALAAERTSKIQLGTGVAITGTRLAPVTAHSIATINRIAPGRTFLGIGAGNTAMRLMGHKPVRLAEYDGYLGVVRSLLDGKETDFSWRGQTAPVRFLMEELGFVATEPRIPMHVSAFGPRSMALAGRHGDGLVTSIPLDPAFLSRALERVASGARDAGRELDLDSFYVTTLTTAVVLDPGESLDSERVVDHSGAFAIASLHYLYDQQRQFGRQPPPHVRPFWDDYCALVEKTPESHRHQRIHAGHNTWLLDEERRFVTPELIEATCLVGTPEQLAARLRELEAAGLDQVMFLPPFACRYEVLERFAREVMPLLT